MEKIEELLIMQLEELSFNILSAARAIDSPIECYSSIKDRKEFSKFSEEEKLADERAFKKLTYTKKYIDKTWQEFASLYRTIKLRIDN